MRRIKCSGSQPCTNCSASSRSCEYPTEQQKITIPEETYKELQERCSVLQRCLEEVVPSEKNRVALLSKWAKPAPATAELSASSSRMGVEEHEKTGDGRILRDPEGFVRYLGESSGAAFMDRLREFVATVLPLLSDKNGPTFASAEEIFTSLLGRYHTHDSKHFILPEDIHPYEIPPPEEIAKLLAVFRFYSQDGTGLPFGGIYYWGNLWDLEEQARRYAEAPSLGNDSRMLANLNAVLALACQFDPSLAPSWELHPGETYFARAKLLLVNPLEDANPMNMRILCLLGQYLLGVYRRDAAYLYIGQAGRTAVIHGYHKGWMIEGQGVAGEQCKREFWNTYICDR